MSSSSSSSSSSLSSQQQKTTTTDLPSAALDQLQWVRIVPKVSLTSSASSLSTIDHPLWWPCLLFNEYEDFQEFFEDELAIIHDDDDDDDALAFLSASNMSKKQQNEVALETRRLILSRIFANMLQRRPVMVARLLGRSIQDYMEIVNISEDQDEETIARIIQILESYQATDYIPFTALSSEERLRQMDPKAFAVAVSNDDSTTTTTIDDDLYMNYMLALDMAATQRIGGMIAPNKTLRSDFRDIARAELAKLSPSIKKLSDTSLAVVTTSVVTNINNNDEIIEEDPKEEVSSDSDDSDNDNDDEENEDKVAVEDDTAAQKVAAADKTKASETKVLQAETTADDASATLPKEDFAAEHSPRPLSLSSGADTEPAAEFTPAASAAAADCSNDDDSDRQERIEEEPEEQNEHEDYAMDSGTQELIEEEPEEQSENENKNDNENENDTMKSSSTVVSFSSEGSCTSPSSHGNEDRKAHTTPSSKSEDEEKDEDPTICPDDTPEEVQNKLELMGWTIDSYGDMYLSPKVGFDDIKSNPYGKGIDYFLDKISFRNFLKKTYGWQKKKKTTKSKATITPKKLVLGGNKGSNTVTPLSSKRLPKRIRRMSGDDVELPKNKKKRFSFESEEEEVFYKFKSLIVKLVKRLGWVYTHGIGLSGAYNYVLPDCKSERHGGEYLVDFFYEESEVIQYCVDNNYFKHRITLGLVEKA
jgi:hypothetical protein